MKEKIDINVDMMLGTFKVIGIDYENPNKGVYFFLKCDCGNTLSRPNATLRNGVFPKCTCKNNKVKIDIGCEIGTFKIISKIGEWISSDSKRWVISCECGYDTDYLHYKLANGFIPICKECKVGKRQRKIANYKRNPKSDIKVGMRYHNMTVISLDEESGGHGKHFRWNLKCDCGRMHNMRSQCIRQAVKPYCDCDKNYEDLTGMVLGKVFITGFAGFDYRWGCKKPRWFYQCPTCGIIKSEMGEVLKRVGYQSCYGKNCRPQGESHKKYKKLGKTRGSRRDGRRRIWCRKIFERDGFKCVACASGGKIQAHHLNGWHWDEEGRFDINNGVTLCKGSLSGCHYNFHKEYGNSYNTKEQLQEYLLKHHGKILDDILNIEIAGTA